MTESVTSQLIGVAVPTLRDLRTGVTGSGGASEPVQMLREAGYAGGSAVHAAFDQWLAESAYSGGREAEVPGAGDLSLGDFGDRASRFFRDAGWGDVTFSSDEEDGTAILDIENCWEGPAGRESALPGCHITTGMLAAFFGEIAGYPVAVLETECCSSGASRCRFLMGNAEVMQQKWETMAEGR
ncbi:MAG TPA: 4-vinyl reductase [Gemmatimonadaceae bacterium]|nr:4-vinyl reductase [Gemmatimonadaceae bacterium]